MINIGVIGAGHWGPNHIRVFGQLNGSTVKTVADLDKERLGIIQNSHPTVAVTTDYQSVLKDSEIDAVIVSVPTQHHFQITKEALEHDKHVLCEKPLAMTEEECVELHGLAEARKKTLMVGHIFLFNSGVQELKKYIESGELGKIHYAQSVRTNLGPFRYDVNAFWDLAPHDISIFNYLFDSAPLNGSARGGKYLGNSLEDVVFANLEYPNNVMVNVHVSWLDPKKVRQITVVGDKKMVTWDDLDSTGPIRLYDKHVEKTATYYETYGEFQLLSREGSITIPKIAMQEPLKAQAVYFLDCVEGKQDGLLSDGKRGADVVSVLRAVEKSLEEKGRSVEVSNELF